MRLALACFFVASLEEGYTVKRRRCLAFYVIWFPWFAAAVICTEYLLKVLSPRLK